MDNKKPPALEQYALFSNLVTHMPMILYVLDMNWTFLVSDGQGLHSIGLKPGEAVGQSARKMYKDYPDIIESLTEAYKGRMSMCTKSPAAIWRTTWRPSTMRSAEWKTSSAQPSTSPNGFKRGGAEPVSNIRENADRKRPGHDLHGRRI